MRGARNSRLSITVAAVLALTLALAGSGDSARIEAAGVGPTISVDAPTVVTPNTPFTVTFSTTGSGFDPYTGFQLALRGFPAVISTTYGPGWTSATCLPPQVQDGSPGSLTAVTVLGCSGAPSTSGAEMLVSMRVMIPEGTTVFAVLANTDSAVPPTTYTIASDGAPQANVLSCGVHCWLPAGPATPNEVVFLMAALPSGTITAHGPAMPTVIDGDTFDTGFTMGASPNEYNGFSLMLVYDSSKLTPVSFANQSDFGAGTFCPPLTTVEDGTLPGVVLPMKAVYLGCAGSSMVTTAQPLGIITWRAVGLGSTAIHIAPTGTWSSGMSTSTVNGLTCGCEMNTPLLCTGTCGPSADLPNAAPWDMTMNFLDPDLALRSMAGAPMAAPGDVQTFALTARTVSTEGGATNVVIHDTFPAGLTPLGATAPGATDCRMSGQTVTCTTAALGVGQSYSVTVQARVATNASGTYTNCASVTLTEIDPNLADNTACSSFTVAADRDGDGWSDAAEISAGKNPAAYCALMRADFNEDGSVNGMDLTKFAAAFAHAMPASRFDQNADGSVNGQDLSMFAMEFTKSVASCP